MARRVYSNASLTDKVIRDAQRGARTARSAPRRGQPTEGFYEGGISSGGDLRVPTHNKIIDSTRNIPRAVTRGS